MPVIAEFVLQEHIRWIADYGIEAAGFHDVGELGVPIKDVNTIAFFFVEEQHFRLLVKIGTDERVAAFDVAAEIGQSALVIETQLRGKGLFRLAFENFQEQRKLGRCQSSRY